MRRQAAQNKFVIILIGKNVDSRDMSIYIDIIVNYWSFITKWLHNDNKLELKKKNCELPKKPITIRPKNRLKSIDLVEE
jgi:hypothetical protein